MASEMRRLRESQKAAARRELVSAPAKEKRKGIPMLPARSPLRQLPPGTRFPERPLMGWVLPAGYQTVHGKGVDRGALPGWRLPTHRVVPRCLLTVTRRGSGGDRIAQRR